MVAMDKASRVNNGNRALRATYAFNMRESGKPRARATVT